MIRVENIEVYGSQAAVRGMRNPMNSWEKSDSEVIKNYADITQEFVMGKNDLGLAERLVTAGVEHRTFCRILTVSMDITAPLYWWKEADRYTVGKVQVSTSTMHAIHKKPFELDDFSWEQLLNTGCDLIEYTWQNGLFKKMVQPLQLLTDFIIPSLNVCREKYLETKDKKYWWQLIQLLPTSYNQKRTVMMSYEVCLKILRERKGHKLDEWEDFRQELLKLPYMQDFWEAANATRN